MTVHDRPRQLQSQCFKFISDASLLSATPTATRTHFRTFPLLFALTVFIIMSESGTNKGFIRRMTSQVFRFPNDDRDQHSTGSNGSDISCPSEPLSTYRKILAFRTITWMLSRIPEERPFKVIDLPENLIGRADRQSLRLSNAIATLAVADRDVTAVVTTRDFGDGILEVITCISGHEIPFISSQPSNPKSFFLKFLLTKNFRRDDGQLSNKVPIVIDAEMPHDLQDHDDDEKVKDYVGKYW